MVVASSAARTQALPSDLSMPAVTHTTTASAATVQIGVSPQIITTPDLRGGLPIGGVPPSATAAGISFSSNTASSSDDSQDSEDDDDDDDLLGRVPASSNTTGSRKRKRGEGSSHQGVGIRNNNSGMMDFFEGLMKQVMEKQEAMQQRFLETIEKREQDRMIREEAWKRQEMARLTREHEIMAQERAISASRDAAIIAFLQKITGQTIQFPPPVVIPAAPPPQATTPAPSPPVQPQQQQQQQQQQQHQSLPPQQPQPQPQRHHHHNQQQQKHQHPPHSTEIVRHQPTPPHDVVVAAVPEQQHPPQEMISGSGSFDSTSSRWPKQEVLALIKLRSGLESRYQEAGPKGPLWEEISTGMQRMGYNRSSKRCKEKWENINKYFKKVKESNKKRPEDAKTCPYFHQLDALYRKKMVGGSSSSTSSFGHQSKQEDSMAIDPSPAPSNLQVIMPPPSQAQPSHISEAENKNKNNKSGTGGNMEEQQSSKEGFFEEGNSGASASALKKKTL
ncbi:hypothetical protein AQUCO_03700343v1 [Aquilegia coerulea]|uniref:Myb-like domain-containing protein n=1 Tax=Aquilegia coerulea TaxID=218851 RepID=A0A2G5CUS9_AQUCA|nr:hypothetical protein AQUCO_03700343v1 [Aquilegia coerulea]